MENTPRVSGHAFHPRASTSVGIEWMEGEDPRERTPRAAARHHHPENDLLEARAADGGIPRSEAGSLRDTSGAARLRQGGVPRAAPEMGRNVPGESYRVP